MSTNPQSHPEKKPLICNEDNSPKSAIGVPETRWQIHVTIDTALCIGDSGVSGILADKTTVKSSDGRLYIPASTFKGIWRHACEAIARGQGKTVCESPRAETMCAENHCIICDVFGSPTKPARILVNDLRTDVKLTEIRPGVTINRFRRTSEDQRLYFTETSPPNAGIEFGGHITISGELSEDTTTLLQAGLRHIHAIGTGKSRGLGWLKLRWETQAETAPESATIPPSDQLHTEIEIEVQLLSPLVAGGRKPAGQAVESLNYVRGGLLRGAVAQSWMADISGEPDADADFRQLFLNENAAIFRNCYPAHQSDTPSVLPATAVSCKDRSGFLKNSDETHGVFDTLLERLAAENVNRLYQPNCPRCQERVEAFSGFYSQHSTVYQNPRLSTRLLTRVAINRHRKAAEDELLYHLSAIDPLEKPENRAPQPAKLIGSACVPSKLVEQVADRLRNRVRRLGGGGSRGLGQVKISVRERPAQFPVKERIGDFNDTLRPLWVAYHHLPTAQLKPLAGTYFSIDLQSDAILTMDDGWQRSMVLTAETLQQLTGCDANIELVRSFAGYDYVGGWNAAWGLPKEIELATRMGSVFVFRTDEIERWIEPLECLEQVGIGSRREEGFGQVVVCEPFHLRTRGELYKHWD